MIQASQFFIITFSQFYQEKERGGKYLSFVGNGNVSCKQNVGTRYYSTMPS